MISVTPEPGHRFAITVRGHVLHVDQPVEEGGEDTAPTPVELFVASLASCTAHLARLYLTRHDLPTVGLSAEASWEMVEKPHRVGSIDVALTLPPGVPEEMRARLLKVASHCTVHNSIENTPDIRIALT